ncbi:alpha/beta fold hydrolase [Rhodococcus sp. 5G237]
MSNAVDEAPTYETTSRFVNAGGIRVHYHEAGTGPSLLLIHGGAPGAFGWGNFGRNLEALSRNFRVVIVDLPGYGRSDKPDVEDGRHLMYAETMAALIDELGLGRTHVVGMATGGAVAARMALDFPERIDKLVLVSSSGGRTMFHVPPRMNAMRAYYAGEGPSLPKMREYLEDIVYDHGLITDEIVWERYEASVDPEFMQKAPEGRSDKRHTPDDLWKRLDEITAPTLIVWGRENRMQPFENAVFMFSRIKHSQLHVFGECGLWVPYEKMEEFDALLEDFLARERASGAAP